MNDAIARLPVVVLNIHSRCNCRCAMCDIWKTSEVREMPLSFIERNAASFVELGVERAALSGGEPFMHSEVFEICTVLRASGVHVTVLTTGLLIERFAAKIAANVDELIVSLDGPPRIHEAIRGVKGAFERIERGLAELRRHKPAFRASARCTVQKANHAHLWQTVAAARDLGLDSISFLAVDTTSAAFNRAVVWSGDRQSGFALTPTEIEILDQQVRILIDLRDPMIADSAGHLRRIVDRFRAYAGMAEHQAPRCNAPWVSAVVDVDGGVRPCFFQPVLGYSAGDLGSVLNSSSAVQFRHTLNIETNPICRRCTCSLYRPDAGC